MRSVRVRLPKKADMVRPSPILICVAVVLSMCPMLAGRAEAHDDSTPVAVSTAFSDLLSNPASRIASGPETDAPTPIPLETLQTVWGLVEIRGFPSADRIAPNGRTFRPLFLLGNDFNLMVWRTQGVYLYAHQGLWGQKAAPGITNAAQGAFDFSKREFVFDVGAAWNYTGAWEVRSFAYSSNNLNRGYSFTHPSGFKDGVGFENRYYLSETYARLGTTGFDIARATFVSLGYYATKTMADAAGRDFKPGLFARAYLTYDVWGPQYYLFADVKYTASKSSRPTLVQVDAGIAARPFDSAPRLELRAGTLDAFDPKGSDRDVGFYLSVRYGY